MNSAATSAAFGFYACFVGPRSKLADFNRGRAFAVMEHEMSEEKFVELVERVFERLDDRPKKLGQHVREWAPVFILAAGMLVTYGRIMQRQDSADIAIAQLQQDKADKSVLKVSLDSQNDKLTMIYNELVEIRKLSYPPSFTAFAPGTKLKARKY